VQKEKVQQEGSIIQHEYQQENVFLEQEGKKKLRLIENVTRNKYSWQ
jgi:hypothetical protein